MEDSYIAVITVVVGALAGLVNFYAVWRFNKSRSVSVADRKTEHFEIKKNDKAIAVDMTGFSPAAKQEMEHAIGRAFSVSK